MYNDVVKKPVYDELVHKVNANQTIKTSDLVKKADCDTKIGKTEIKQGYLTIINILLSSNVIN